MNLFFKKIRNRNKINENLSATTRSNYEQYLASHPATCNANNHEEKLSEKELGDTPLIAVDFETTGLNETYDEIISMGFCPIVDNKIRLADCLHIVIKPEQALSSENVAIHGLTDDQVNAGLSPELGLSKFLELTKGKVIVAHYHQIERTFIQNLAKKILGRPIPLSIIDTFEVAKTIKRQNQQPITSNSLRLFNLRNEIGLPHYKAHNALEDAISTAELLLAQQALLDLPNEKIFLKQLGLINYKK
ncbi:exonuclease domain-containing protein [Aliikangiella coralliicola]|uniref:DNA polymerase III subunit epsilon n=1 Tax=Aliikangiella coralliicola TaxID=2592383 RepID=A0A545UCW0_9GAMM|nr:exonuclease domain-containing protein [Aliikangiella coralliicola]TQV87298.1 DNA polymerase III subunit epsilon [Aliikangiella coralliicola]